MRQYIAVFIGGRSKAQKALRGLALALLCAWATAGQAQGSAAQHWVDSEFRPSSLTRAQQLQELDWFTRAAAPLRQRGVRSIRVVSEQIHTHAYEARTLARAFTELTGIAVQHELLSEGELVERLYASMRQGTHVYDGWVSDSDLIGTHYRYGAVVPLSEYMQGVGREYTNPGLDLQDFIGLQFTTAPDGKLYQLPDQQFANLYWFRADWFARPELRERFEAKYHYPLGVPLNWSAYEDIAEFFTHDVREIDGVRVWGHMDYGKRDPSLGWRFTDAWLSMAGAADKGIPNGLPVDEWGIRVAPDQCTPVGASVARGGATNSPAAVLALDKYVRWLKNYAPPEALGMTFTDAGPVPGQGQIAQQIFWYTAFTSAMTQPGSAVVHPDGSPKWRMAPSPHGPYWKTGMQNGYQDVGAWTFLRSTPPDQMAAAWLYAQFLTSKTVSLRKSIVGLTFIRESDIKHPYFTQNAHRYGGLIEFYRSPARVAWTPTGTNVPDYPRMAPLWWRNVATAVSGEKTPQQAMDRLAQDLDDVLASLQRSGMQRCTPRLNAALPGNQRLSAKGAPWQKLDDERPHGETIPYERLLQAWKEGRVR
ncbi:MAG: ABC transporter substrate-binding protein [Rhodoferax sp.]